MRPSDEVDALRSAPMLLISSFLLFFYTRATGVFWVDDGRDDERILFLGKERRRGGEVEMQFFGNRKCRGIGKEMRRKDDLDLKKKDGK